MANLKSLGNRGYAMILDSIMALVFVLIVFSAVYGFYFTRQGNAPMTAFRSLGYLSEDSLDVLNKNGVLDVIGEQWSMADGNTSSIYFINATNISREYLDQLLPQTVGYRLTIDEDVVAENNRTPEGLAPVKTHATRLLVGYGSGLPVRGNVARSYITHIKSKEEVAYSYFGGLVGQGNITQNLYIPTDAETIIKAYVEADAGAPFQLIVNGNTTGCCAVGAVGNMSANVKEYVASPASFFRAGNNTLLIQFTSGTSVQQYIGGGHVKVTFNTSSPNQGEDTGYLKEQITGIEGLINLYSSFYVPGTIQAMHAHIEYISNYSSYMYVGDTLIYQSEAGNYTNQTLDLTDAQLSALLNYNQLSQKTVPFSIGTNNVTRYAETELSAGPKAILYPTSYIEFNYTPQNTTLYGEIEFTLETPRFNDTANCSYNFEVPQHFALHQAHFTSYTSQYWTDYATANAHTAYTLRDSHFGSNYSILGDPYLVYVQPTYIDVNANNTLRLETGTDPTTPTGCSADNRLIYTILLPTIVPYGDVFPQSAGCQWNIEFQDDSTITTTIPSTYNGTAQCNYTTTSTAINTGDAQSDAVLRLLRILDIDSDGKINVLLEPNAIQFELSRAGGVQSLWGPIKYRLTVWE
ncbi:Uncharacterised protein [uncultured archaeon]|nr:Uncharacterised protein [uncultured archaeon]